ncbi:hypothetical protein WMF37_37680 [Sorangium sp. So ce291]|uniref:hypothetical protein n=1 Tax=Sorangium sp. So ce291 TaxID=3133294 RepID=UPI003F6307EA
MAEFRAVHNIESLEQNAADLGPERARASRGEAPSLAGALYGENPLLPSVANTFVGVQGSINGNGADQAMISP